MKNVRNYQTSEPFSKKPAWVFTGKFKKWQKLLSPEDTAPVAKGTALSCIAHEKKNSCACAYEGGRERTLKKVYTKMLIRSFLSLEYQVVPCISPEFKTIYILYGAMLHNMQFVFLSVYKSWIFIQGLHFYANVLKEHANNSRTVFLMCYKPSHGVYSTCSQIFRQTFS